MRVRYTAGSFLYVDVDMFHHWTLLSRPTSRLFGGTPTHSLGCIDRYTFFPSHLSVRPTSRTQRQTHAATPLGIWFVGNPEVDCVTQLGL